VSQGWCFQKTFAKSVTCIVIDFISPLHALLAFQCIFFVYNPHCLYYGGNGKKMTYTQFAATLAYAITDYKCQAKTFEWVVVDIKKPGGRGSSPAASAYVQLSRAKTRHSLSILRPFDPTELSSKFSTELLQELEWQAEKAKETEALYNF